MLALSGRDLAAFLLFSEERRHQLLKAKPGMTFKEINPILEEEWENMTKSQRAVWRRMVGDDEEKKDPAPPVAPREHKILTSGQQRARNNRPSTNPNPEASYVNLPKLPRGAYHYDPVKPGMTLSEIAEAKDDFEESLMYEQSKPLPTTMNQKLAQSRRLEEEARRNREEMKWRAEGDWEHLDEVDYTDDPETMHVPDDVGEVLGQGIGKGKSVAGRIMSGGQRAVKWLTQDGYAGGEEAQKEGAIAEDWLYEPDTKVDTSKHDPSVEGAQPGAEMLEPESRKKNTLPRRRKTKLDTLKECVEAVGYGASLVDKFARKKL
jgi:hypothetical protein